MSLDWVHAFLQNPPEPAVSQIYAVATWSRPKYVPELILGQWWSRADVDLRFNESVQEESTTPSAASAEVIITTDTGMTETINMVS